MLKSNVPLNLLQIICLIIVCLAAVIDMRTHKIPNLITFPGALLALVLQFVLYHGIWGLLWGVTGWLLGLTVTLLSRLPPLLLRRYKQDAIGFGDVKLIALVGAFLGPYQVLVTFFFFCLFFGGMCIIQLAKAIPWFKLWSIVAYKTIPQLSTPEVEHIKTIMRSPVPLAPAIALGTICAIVLFPSTIK